MRARAPLAAADASAREPVVVASSLTKRFGELVAVDELTFSLRAGTVTGFLGPNGAGKTTTLRAGGRGGGTRRWVDGRVVFGGADRPAQGLPAEESSTRSHDALAGTGSHPSRAIQRCSRWSGMPMPTAWR
ncbi:MAG: ATP-binding cassette domain-containing protein [Acidimicrobiia bacterium]